MREFTLWSANAAMKSLFDTLNIVYGEEEKRGFVTLNAISLLFTVGGILFVVAALGARGCLDCSGGYTVTTNV
jgi:membrane protein